MTEPQYCDIRYCDEIRPQRQALRADTSKLGRPATGLSGTCKVLIRGQIALGERPLSTANRTSRRDQIFAPRRTAGSPDNTKRVIRAMREISGTLRISSAIVYAIAVMPPPGRLGLTQPLGVLRCLELRKPTDLVTPSRATGAGSWRRAAHPSR